MFQVGDRVIHWTYGPGQIVQVEEKQVASEMVEYYKVQVKDLTIWVPLKEFGEAALAQPDTRQGIQEADPNPGHGGRAAG